MPKIFNHASPFHASFFLTNLGSIGIESIYHHLYEFGTCSMFVAMGKKTKENVIEKNGEIKTNKSILLKFVLDERICDGFYYARSMRMLEKILSNPSDLLFPPKEVLIDEGVRKRKK
ncbi:MAG TPA: 2-oxo acid dehydrogenase subunit E2, partial [Ignavibacteria bacterium]